MRSINKRARERIFRRRRRERGREDEAEYNEKTMRKKMKKMEWRRRSEII
jgi:hypothetical protein